MDKPSFGIVTGVVTILAALAFLSKITSDLIPEGPENRLAGETGEFLLQASHEEIDWHTLGEEAFSEARKKDKPILLVIGSACSPTGRMADSVLFTAKEVRGFLSRNFVCVRVDSMDRPEMANAFLPLSRAVLQTRGRATIPPDFQVWFLDPRGYLFGFGLQSTEGQALDYRAFLTDLENAVDRYSKLRESPSQAGSDQKVDLSLIRTDRPPELPDLSKYVSYLSAATADAGGFPINGLQRLWPSAWRFQLLTGHYDDYIRSVDPCLTSPFVDLLDGGFFTDFSASGWRNGGYDKLAVANASMMYTLGLSSVLLKDQRHRWLAAQTFDSLSNEFIHNGFVSAGRVGDEKALGRSARSSFPPRLLRELLPDDSDRDWVRTRLGLMVETNPQMSPMLSNLNTPNVEGTKFDLIMKTLRKGRPAVRFVGSTQLDVGGFVSARMLQTARLLGDGQRLLVAEGVFEHLDEFRSLDDVVHSRAPGVRAHAYLGDYLAYADGALQYFLATGRSETLANGLSVLRRALFLYGGNVKGVYNLSVPNTSPLSAQDVDCPEILDSHRESCSAQVIRLCNDYGRLLGPAGADLRVVASDTLLRFAQISPGLGQFAGAYYCAAADMMDGDYALAVGPDALKLSCELATMAPTRLVAPASAMAKAPGSAPGIYVVHGAEVHGPLSVDQATTALRRSSL